MCCGQINVKDAPYSATGNGTTNDRNAIQSAIDAAALAFSGGSYLRVTVCIPAGAYRCDSGLTIPYGVSLSGHPGGTVLDFTNASSSVTAIQWGTSATDVSQGVLSGLTMYGPGTSTSSVGIMAGDSSSSGSNKVAYCAMRDCFIRGFGTGIRLGSNCFVNKFEKLRVGYNGLGLGLTSSPLNFGLSILFEFCSFGSNTKHFNVDAANGGLGITFSACSFDYATGTPQAQIGAGVAVFFDKCHWETDEIGVSGTPLLVEILYPCSALVFRDTRFVLPLDKTVDPPEPEWVGYPIYWNSGASSPTMTVTFDLCQVEGDNGILVYGAPSFYGRNSSYASAQPVALAIQSPGVTADTGKLRVLP